MSSTMYNSLETIPEVEEENENKDRGIVQVGEGLQAQTNPDTSVKEDNDKCFFILSFRGEQPYEFPQSYQDMLPFGDRPTNPLPCGSHL